MSKRLGLPSSTHGRTAMNFGFSEEQEELRKMVKRFLEEKSPESEVRRLMATAELYVGFEEMGDALIWSPYFSTVALAANAVNFVGTDPDKESYQPGIVTGET